MMENYYCAITVFYIKLFLLASMVLGIPIILLLSAYRHNVNECIINEVAHNITTDEAIKKCDAPIILFILFMFIQVSILAMGGAMHDNKEFEGKPIKPDNANLELENTI